MKNMRYRTLLGILVASLLGTMIFISIFSPASFTVYALEFQLGLHFCEQGVTQVELPPIGAVRAQTHKVPLLLTVRLINIDSELLENMLEELPDQDELVSTIKKRAIDVARLYSLRIVAISALGGAFGVFLLRKKAGRLYLSGAGIGILLSGILLSGMYYTYDINRFQNPEYRGLLQAAPWAVNLAQNALGAIDTINNKMQIMADNLYDIFQRVGEPEHSPEDKNTLKVLHVSDIHNNPAAVTLMQRVADNFGADLIIDTGDISDYGTPLEALLLERLGEIKAPYLFIAGNHDSPFITFKMSEIPGVTVVDGYIEILNLRIMGFPDPAAATNDIASLEPEQVEEHHQEILQRVGELPAGVDILAVHNHRLGNSLAGEAPVILFGHNHAHRIEEQKNSILINAGTTGAAGLRGLQSINTPYTLVLLHFSKTEEGMLLVAADTIKVYNLNSEFTVERRVFNTRPEQMQTDLNH